MAKAAIVLNTARMMADDRIDFAAANFNWLMIWYVELLLDACKTAVELFAMLMFMA